MKMPIYMDNNATTRTDPRVVEAMLPYFTEIYGNAACRNHPFGWEAEAAVEEGREQIATLLKASAKEIIFTSGATESNNLAIKGVAAMYKKKGNHIITQATEHKAVLDTCKRLERDGFQVTYLPVDKHGQVHAEQSREAQSPTRRCSCPSWQRTTKSARFSRSRASARCARKRACFSTPTRCNRSARSRSTSRRWGSTC